jgi:hypothetical protein
LEELDRLLKGESVHLHDSPNLEEEEKEEPPTVQVLGAGRVAVAGQTAFIKLVRLPGSGPTVYVPGLVVSSEDE